MLFIFLLFLFTSILTQFQIILTSQPFSSIFLVFIILLLIIHYRNEGLCLQFVPIYLTVAFVGIQIFILDQNKYLLTRIFCLLLDLTSFIVYLFFPPTSLPDFNVPVATTLLAVETTRFFQKNWFKKEINLTKSKKLYFKLWYPSDSVLNTKNRAKYLSPSNISTNRLSMGQLPKFLRSLLCSSVNPGLIWEGSLSKSQPKYPVVVYSHGQEFLPEGNTRVLKDIAARGFIVVAPYHNDKDKSFPGPAYNRIYDTYDTLRVLYLLESLEKLPTYGSYQKTSKILKMSTLNFNSDGNNKEKGNEKEKEKESHQNGFELNKANILKLQKDQIKTWLNETKTDDLPSNIFNNKLDLDRIALLGFSFGGTTVWNCLSKITKLNQEIIPQFKCAAALDLWSYPLYDKLIVENPITVPLMLISTSIWNEKTARNNLQDIIKNSKKDSSLIITKNSTHFDFTDVGFIWNNSLLKKLTIKLFDQKPKQFPLLGTIDQVNWLHDITQLVETFFGNYLEKNPKAFLISELPFAEDLFRNKIK